MAVVRPLVLLCSIGAVFAPTAHAQETLTLTDVLARARDRSPQVIAARLAVDEARARLIGAGLRLQNNPELDFGIGRRSGQLDASTELDIGLSQMFEPAGRREARTSAANAAIERSVAASDAILRSVLRDAALAYYRVVHADQRLALLASAENVAASLHQAADRRHRSGDIAVLDVNLARAAWARVRSSREAAAADRIAAMGTLRHLLQLETDVKLASGLSDRAPLNRTDLITAALQRPELREIEFAIREAEADLQLSRTFSRPDLGFGVTFQREEGDQVVGGALKLTLPVFSKGQELRASSVARASRLRTELEATRSRIRVEVESAADAYDRRVAAVQLLEKEAIPGLDENEALTARSFEVGQIGLPDLLLIRREILETRFQYLDALLDAALARVELDAAAGVLR